MILSDLLEFITRVPKTLRGPDVSKYNLLTFILNIAEYIIVVCFYKRR